MNTITTIALLCLLAILIFSIYMLYRNNKVYAYRIKKLKENRADYYKLPSYDRMFYSIKPLTDKYWVK